MRPGGSSDDGSRAIYVCIAVDVEGVIAAFPEKKPTAKSPRRIDGNSGLVIATSPAGNDDETVETEGTSALSRAAHLGDDLRVYAVSGSNNFDAAVLLVGVGTGGDTRVLGPFELVALEQIPVTPSGEPLTLKNGGAKQQFWFWQAPIAGSGTERCHAVLALYGRDDHGQPSLAGYYRWDFPLTVKLTEAEDEPTQGVAS